MRACAAGECVPWDDDAEQRVTNDLPLIVELAGVTGPTAVTAVLTVTSLTEPGRVVFESGTQVELAVYYPNGSGCEPTVYQGWVHPTDAGDLVPFAPA